MFESPKSSLGVFENRLAALSPAEEIAWAVGAFMSTIPRDDGFIGRSDRNLSFCE